MDLSILRRKCLLKHVIDGKIDRKRAGTGRRERKRKHTLDDLKEKEKKVELERESTRSHSVRKSLWKRLCTCRKADYVNERWFSENSNFFPSPHTLTLILLMWRIWWAPNNATKWQMPFNSAFKVLNLLQILLCYIMFCSYSPVLFFC
jgi:hypothetical protein